MGASCGKNSHNDVEKYLKFIVKNIPILAREIAELLKMLQTTEDANTKIDIQNKISEKQALLSSRVSELTNKFGVNIQRPVLMSNRNLLHQNTESLVQEQPLPTIPLKMSQTISNPVLAN